MLLLLLLLMMMILSYFIIIICFGSIPMGLWINPHSWLWLSPFYFWDWWSLPQLPKKTTYYILLRAVLRVCKYTYSTVQSKHAKRSTCLGLKMHPDWPCPHHLTSPKSWLISSQRCHLVLFSHSSALKDIQFFRWMILGEFHLHQWAATSILNIQKQW